MVILIGPLLPACVWQGARDYQEDTVACVASPAGLAGGVFDGHGGDDVSKELERVLLQVCGLVGHCFVALASTAHLCASWNHAHWA